MSRPKYRVTRFLQTPLGRALEDRLHRFGPWKSITSRLVWREIHQDPEAMADIAEGMADIAAGRVYQHDEHWQWYPLPSWSPDDPKQPEGWVHDGTAWRKQQ